MKDRKSHAYDSHGVSATELRERLERSAEQLKSLYVAINEMMMLCYYEGEICISNPLCDDVISTLHDIDGGEYDVEQFEKFLRLEP